MAAKQASGSLLWIGVDSDGPSDLQRLQAEHAVRMQRISNFHLVDVKNSPELRTHDMLCNDLEPWRTCGTWMMPILVPSYLHEFDDANAKVGAERNPQKTEVVCYVDDLDAALLGGQLATCRKWHSLHSNCWKYHTRSCCGAPTVHRGPALGQGRRH